MAEPLTVLTWNVAGRLTRLDEQADRVLAHRPRVINLQPPGWPQPLHVVTLHAPLSQREDQVKIRTLEAVHASLAALGDHVPAILCGDFNHAFRSLHGFEARDRSWKAGRHPGYRLDHILVSPALTVAACAYDHGVREDGLSDHSAMTASIVS